ncbi:MAG: hypothetical protein ABFD84_01040 [Candidatus Polarisedimenticolia bacterium]
MTAPLANRLALAAEGAYRAAGIALLDGRVELALRLNGEGDDYMAQALEEWNEAAHRAMFAYLAREDAA